MAMNCDEGALKFYIFNHANSLGFDKTLLITKQAY